MCPPARTPTEQEKHGRHGRPITDQDAHDISRVEELSYDLKIREVMTADVKTATPEMPLSNPISSASAGEANVARQRIRGAEKRIICIGTSR